LVSTLRAALYLFPPGHVFVCDIGDSEKPTDNTARDICHKMTQEYRLQHNLPTNSPQINYLWCPERNKIVAYWWAAKYYCKYKYVMTIDDRVRLPRDLII